MADRTIVLRLRAEIADLKRQMGEAGLAVKGVGDEAQKASKRSTDGIDAIANRAGLLGAAMVAAAGVAVLAFANFDAAMSGVQAATHESAETMDLLRDAALDAGARTKYSATEAAGAIEELAKAGISASDILGGGLDGALDLAAAGNLDVAEAAGIAAVTLKQFNLEGGDVSHVADLLAAGAGKAMGDVTDLGQALKQAGLVANSTGLSIEETTAGLSAFAAAGLIGSDAGTSFKAMLQRLTPQSAEAQAKFDELGISAYDAQGNFVGLEKFAGNLQSAMRNLTPEARNSALAVMFGSDAVRAANVLYDEGADGIKDWTEKVNDSGYAAETAGIRMDNLKGDWEELTGSVETALIGLGEGANGPLRDLVSQATEVVNAFAEMPAGVQGALLAIVGVGGFALLGIAGVGKVTVAVSETIASFKALSTTAKITGLATGAALAVGTIALSAWAQQAAEARARTEELGSTLDDLGNVTDETVSSINKALSKDRNDWLDNLFGKDPESLIDRAEKFGLAIEDLQGYILGEADAVDKVTAATKAYIEANDDTASSRNDAEFAVSEVVGALDDESRALTTAEKETIQKAEADEAAGIAAKEQAEATKAATSAIDTQVDALANLLDAQREQMGVVLSERDAQRQYEAALDDATASIDAAREAGVGLADMLDRSTDAGRANETALDDIAKSGRDVIESMRENGATQEELQGAMQRTRDDVIAFGIAMGLSEADAVALADQMKLIPAEVPITVTANTADATAMLEAFRLKWAGKSIGEVSMQIRLDAPNLDRSQLAQATRMTAEAASWANRNAEGGYITGPGTSTSDSIPARLSNGEYVIKADSVSRYGKGFFDSLNAQRFATGGFVGSSQAAPAPASRMPDVSVVVERMETGTPQDVGREVGWALVGRQM